VKEIAGIKIAIIGITTPGMSFWLSREFTVGIDFQYPVESVRRAIAKANSDGADALCSQVTWDSSRAPAAMTLRIR